MRADSHGPGLGRLRESRIQIWRFSPITLRLEAPFSLHPASSLNTQKHSWFGLGGRFEQLTLGGFFALLIFLGAVLGFISLASLLQGPNAPSFDIWALRALRQPGDPAVVIGPAWLPVVARDLTALGGVAVITGSSLVVLGFLFLRRKHRAALFLIGALLGGVLLSIALKVHFLRPRPSIVPHLMVETSGSFPSGHSMLSAVCYLTLAALLMRQTRRRSEQVYLFTVVWLVIIAVGCSRVILGVHYPTDVLGGWAAGTAWALLCSFIERQLQRRGGIESPDDQL